MDVSYFSGKLEAYLRWKEIPYERVEVGWRQMQRELLPRTGLMKVPSVETPAGEWLQDSTPIIDWMEARYAAGAVIPPDPEQAFHARLLEDYADEWLWRPALHYRWSYASDAHLLGHRIAREVMFDLPGPATLKAMLVRRRQRRTYVSGDGVTPETRAHVEGVYLGALDRLQRGLEHHRFVLGDRPSLADFGFFASMFRHFALDPTPSRIMRDRAPAVWAWVARLWNARHSQEHAPWPERVPDALDDWLRNLAETYLPYLHANAVAFREGRRVFDWTVQGVTYRATPVVQYRVWCRERLQASLAALPEGAGTAVRARLERAGALMPLLRDGSIASGLHPSDGPPPPLCAPRGRPGFVTALRGSSWNPARSSPRGDAPGHG